MTQVSSEHLGEALGTDFFSVREQFTDEQWSHFIAVRRFVGEEVVSVVGPYGERAEMSIAMCDLEPVELRQVVQVAQE